MLREKSGAGLTVRASVAECCKLPLVPVSCSEYLPAAALLAVEIVKIRPAAPTFWGRFGEIVRPAGSVPAASETVPENPFLGVMLA
jgi:hypothetical protein